MSSSIPNAVKASVDFAKAVWDTVEVQGLIGEMTRAGYARLATLHPRDERAWSLQRNLETVGTADQNASETMADVYKRFPGKDPNPSPDTSGDEQMAIEAQEGEWGEDPIPIPVGSTRRETEDDDSEDARHPRWMRDAMGKHDRGELQLSDEAVRTGDPMEIDGEDDGDDHDDSEDIEEEGEVVSRSR